MILGDSLASQTRDEGEIRVLIRRLRDRGIEIRREKLSRGREFRVKSGTARVFGQKILFVDRALPEQQQLGILVDYIIEQRIVFTPDELSQLSPARRKIFLDIQRQQATDDEPLAINSSGLGKISTEPESDTVSEGSFVQEEIAA